jgi:hypothetical protein
MVITLVGGTMAITLVGGNMNGLVNSLSTFQICKQYLPVLTVATPPYLGFRSKFGVPAVLCMF